MKSHVLVITAMAGAMALAAGAQAPKQVKVQLTSSKGEKAGTVTFKPAKKGGVKMTIKLENMPFGQHGVHIHEHAACDAPDFKSAGGHFNPTGKHHGFENPEGHHAGDTPQSVSVDESHAGEASFTLADLSLDPAAPNSIFANGGTSVVVHEHADDEKTDPSGNSGNRIACGIIKP